MQGESPRRIDKEEEGEEKSDEGWFCREERKPQTDREVVTKVRFAERKESPRRIEKEAEEDEK